MKLEVVYGGRYEKINGRIILIIQCILIGFIFSSCIGRYWWRSLTKHGSHLMIPTYAASSDPKIWKDFVIPEDDKVIISIHAYTPYDFALNKNGTAEWNPIYLMDNLFNSFASKGYPVIIGEFGAMNKDNIEARVSWAKYYVQKAKEKGIPCIWWDNGPWQYPEVIEALMSGLQ